MVNLENLRTFVYLCVCGLYTTNTVMWKMRAIPFEHCCMLPGADATQLRLKKFNMKREIFRVLGSIRDDD